MKVGYLGAPGSFSYQAANAYFTADHDFIGFPTFADLFQQTEEGGVAASLVPVENSLTGPINDSCELLAQSPVQVIGEQSIKVEHCLLAHAGIEVPDVQTVYSHAKAIEQCQHFLARHSHITSQVTSDTATAAQQVARDGKQAHSAAIAAKACAALYGLHIIASGLEDNTRNYTRFVVVTGAGNVK